MTDELKECRESFEKWYLDNELNHSILYKERCRTAWQAAWQQSRTKPEGVDIEVGARAIAMNRYYQDAVPDTDYPQQKWAELNKSYYEPDAKACAAAWHLTAKE